MNPAELIDRYCAVWNETDAARRRAMLHAVWAEGATYTDPTVHARGVDELVAHIGTVQAKRPGARILRTSVVEGHHGMVRFHWHAALAEGTTLPEGIDIAWLSEDGNRIEKIVGFFGPLMRS